MAKIIGLTGGIGSGKSTAAKMFKDLGVPTYIADDEAKSLMNRSKVIKRKLVALLGEQAYTSDGINRSYIAKYVFEDKSLLKKINEIVHPKVAAHFKRWLSKQDVPYIIKEAAIIFENNLQNQYHKIITVVAPIEDRIDRVMKRDGTSRERILAIMKNQLSDDKKIEQSDFVIYNTNLKELQKQINLIDKELSNMP